MPFGIRSGGYVFCLAGLQEFAPFIMGIGEDWYQLLAIKHLSDHVRMHDPDVAIHPRHDDLGELGKPPVHKRCLRRVHGDVQQSNQAGASQNAIPGNIKQLAPEHRMIARYEVEHRVRMPETTSQSQ